MLYEGCDDEGGVLRFCLNTFDRVHVLLLCGSLRAGSTNEAVLHTIEQLHDGSAELYRGTATLPHFNPDDDADPLPPTVAELRAAIGRADALLVCTPEYAGDLPGAFKNLLDWTVGGMETVGKPAGWINASTSPGGAVRTHEALTTVLTYTGCNVVEAACVHVPVPREAIVDGIVIDAALRSRLAAPLDALRRAVQNGVDA
jgi:NAD(P)H-dependent FMN reductase